MCVKGRGVDTHTITGRTEGVRTQEGTSGDANTGVCTCGQHHIPARREPDGPSLGRGQAR